MTDTGFSYGKLFIQPSQRLQTVGAVSVADPPAADAANLGRIFFVGEVRNANAENGNILQAIQDELNRNYYGTDDLDIEKAFEKALESTNRRIADLVGDHDTDWLEQCGAIAAVVTNSVVHISTIGSIHAFLIRGNRIINILQSAGDDASLNDPINPLKAFSNIISGDVEVDDVLLFTTPSILDYFSLEKLRRTVSERHPSQATSQIQSLLQENANNTTFGMAIAQIRNQPAPEAGQQSSETTASSTPHQEQYSEAARAAAVADMGSESSMESLLQKQANTSNVLTPSLRRYMRERSGDVWQRFRDFLRLKLMRQSPRRVRLERDMRAHQQAHRPPPAVANAPARTESTTLVDMAKKVGGAGMAVGRTVGSLAKKKPKAESVAPKQRTPVSQMPTRMIAGFKRLPRISKLLVGLAVLVLFFLAQGIYSTALSRYQSAVSVEHEQTFSQISQNILKAEAALTYDNTAGAKELLAEAQTLLATIETDDEDELAKIAELENGIQVQLEKTRNIIRAETTPVVDLANTDAGVRSAGLVGTGDFVYTYDAAADTIYEINHTDNSVNPYAQDDEQRSWINMAIDGDALLLLASDNSLDVFDTDTYQLSNQSFDLADNANIVDSFVYNGRYYTLDISNNQIYRATSTGIGYGTPSDWISDGSDVSTAAALAIDGFIYTGHTDGALNRFFQGQRQDWAADAIEPALGNVTDLWTSADTDYLYVLDGAGGRLISYTKEGIFVAQYVADVLNGSVAVSVDPQTSTAYVLSTTAVYSFSLITE